MCSVVKLSGLELGVSGPSVDEVTLVETIGKEDDEFTGNEPGRK